jgi:glycosyltransferase involved in cell wall biosynthesis
MITDLPFSFTAHAKDLYSESLNPAGLLKRKLQAARFAVTCTEANRRYMEALGSGTPIYRIYHGLNADFARLLAEASSAPTQRDPASPLRLLGVGRLVPKKGFDLFVQACAILRQRGVPVEAVIVGEDGEHSKGIRRQIAELGLDEVVRLTGPMSQADLYQEYQRATVFCLPCRVLDDGDRDGIPNVLVEAMATRLPIVTTAISGIPELITDGVNGLLAPPEDANAIADAVLRLYHEPELADRLSAAAIGTVQSHFDGEDAVRPLILLFQDALHRPTSRPVLQAARSVG